jgi:hypothetical protein
MSENNGGAFSVRVDFERILETIAARIYDSQFAFLRENVQNAIDAVRIQARRDGKSPGDADYQIDIAVAGNECRITDRGIGMTREQLQANFWTMGASGKNTPEARAAGCIGTFGIGGFANFGVCETVEVTSRTENCDTAHQTSLSRSSFGSERYSLPTVDYAEVTWLTHRGTSVKGIGKGPFNPTQLENYIREFVRFVDEPIFFNGAKLSQAKFAVPQHKREIAERATNGGLTYQFFADGDQNIAAGIQGAELDGVPVECSGYVRLVHGSLDVYKRGFRICSVTVPTRIGVTGRIDCDQLRPTAGRDTLDSNSTALLTKMFQVIESAAKEHILKDPELLAAHIRLVPDFVQQGKIEALGVLEVDRIGGLPLSLNEIRGLASHERKVFYTASAAQTPATEVLAARGHIIVRISGNHQRRPAEVAFLQRYCGAQELDGLIDCLEHYDDLDSFERGIITEVDFSVRKLFKPPMFKLVPGRLTLDTPIFWTDRRENGAIIVFIDPRHGEFQKLRPLGFTHLFWSMVEAFCREYLGETLKRQSVKLFGTGAIDLDAFSKANSELWELVLDDIEVSQVGLPGSPARPSTGQVQVVSRSDISQVTISNSGVVENDPSSPGEKKAAKILQIVDATGTTGLQGYYLRIPQSATAAFGDIIRTLPQFAVVWFANRVTWQGCDPENATAFLFDVTLDRFIAAYDDGLAAHGALELTPSQVHHYEDQIYFFVPPQLQGRIIPGGAGDLIKLQVRHELVDLHRARAWTAKEQLAEL